MGKKGGGHRFSIQRETNEDTGSRGEPREKKQTRKTPSPGPNRKAGQTLFGSQKTLGREQHVGGWGNAPPSEGEGKRVERGSHGGSISPHGTPTIRVARAEGAPSNSTWGCQYAKSTYLGKMTEIGYPLWGGSCSEFKTGKL